VDFLFIIRKTGTTNIPRRSRYCFACNL
jgi:hypothetical protein